MVTTKKTKTQTTATRSMPTESNVDLLTSSTLATKAVRQRDNDEKVQRPKAIRNIKQYHTTTTSPENMDTPCIDDMAVISSPSERRRVAEFETVVDGQSIRQDCGGIPEWTPMQFDLNVPADVTTTKFVDAYDNPAMGKGHRKTPRKIELTLEDNMTISQSHVPGFEGELMPLPFQGYKAGSNMSQTVTGRTGPQ